MVDSNSSFLIFSHSFEGLVVVVVVAVVVIVVVVVGNFL